MSEAAEPEVSTELALAVYAATAATSALKSLHQAGIANDALLKTMAQHAFTCSGLTNQDPRIEEHIEKLVDMLLSGLDPR